MQIPWPPSKFAWSDKKPPDWFSLSSTWAASNRDHNCTGTDNCATVTLPYLRVTPYLHTDMQHNNTSFCVKLLWDERSGLFTWVHTNTFNIQHIAMCCSRKSWWSIHYCLETGIVIEVAVNIYFCNSRTVYGVLWSAVKDSWHGAPESPEAMRQTCLHLQQ